MQVDRISMHLGQHVFDLLYVVVDNEEEEEEREQK